MEKVWTKEELWEHIRINTTEKAGGYSSVVVIAALYKKLYGEFPKVGMSGAQAEMADSLILNLPQPNKGVNKVSINPNVNLDTLPKGYIDDTRVNDL